MEEKGSLDNQTAPRVGRTLPHPLPPVREYKNSYYSRPMRGRYISFPLSERAAVEATSSQAAAAIKSSIIEQACALLPLGGEQSSNILHEGNVRNHEFPQVWFKTRAFRQNSRTSRILGSKKSYLWWFGNFSTTKT